MFLDKKETVCVTYILGQRETMLSFIFDLDCIPSICDHSTKVDVILSMKNLDPPIHRQAMVQDSITDHIFDRPQFFFISSYRVMFDINGKVFSLSIG